MLTYTIHIPETNLQDLQDFMSAHNLSFDPKRQLTAVNDTFMDASTAMGHHAPSMVEALNEHLTARGLMPTVPEYHPGWPPDRVQAFLDMAVEKFQWDDNSITTDWWEHDGERWQDVVDKYPKVFQT